MKKIHLPLIVVGLLSASSVFASFSTVVLTQNTQAYSGSYGGGEFNAVTSANGTFQTFCIDVGHNFTPGVTYNYTISGHTTTPNILNNISIGTAWLYNEFLNGTLNNYLYTDGSGNTASATKLQSVFWGLEGMTEGNSSATYFNNSNPFYNAVVSQFGTLAAAEQDSNGAYGVAVMNLFSGSNPDARLAQSQLIQLQTSNGHPSIPEPSTVVAGALMLLPFGVSALRIIRRKQAAKI